MTYKVTTSDDGTISLNAGEVQGITKNSHFNIYASTDAKALPLVQLAVQDLGPSWTVLTGAANNDIAIPSPAWGWITKGSLPAVNLSISGSTDNNLHSICESVVEAMSEHYITKSHIRLVDVEHNHELTVLKNSDGRIVFDIADQTCRAFGLERIPHSITLDASSLSLVFDAAANFFHYLQRSIRRSPLSQHLSLQSHVLEEHYPQDTDIFPVLRPTGANLIIGGVMLPEVYIAGDEDYDEDPKCYGFKLVSTWNKPLYVWIFAFEMNDLGIGGSHFSAYTFDLYDYSTK
jgi:hypothetical protein